MNTVIPFALAIMLGSLGADLVRWLAVQIQNRYKLKRLLQTWGHS